MKLFIEKLPLDIILQIIPYTYEIQNKSLLNDIVNFKESKNKLLNLYYDYWFEIEPGEYKNWLINDIFGYANNYNALMFGYVDKFYNIFFRNICLQTKEDVENYVSNMEKKEASTQINIFLGLLKKEERKKIIFNFQTRSL
jgi:hypothetical protein